MDGQKSRAPKLIANYQELPELLSTAKCVSRMWERLMELSVRRNLKPQPLRFFPAFYGP